MIISINEIWVTLGLYVAILVGVAWLGEKKRQNNNKFFESAFIYSLSLAVYCTSWTFYGSVGTASTSGLLFLTIYLGPMISTILWSNLLVKMVRVKNKFRITSIVDLISARYDKSEGLGIVATTLLIFGIIPYIALQLKAIVRTIHIVASMPQVGILSGDYIGIYVALMLSIITIFFGIRKLNTTERHPGMVLVLAFESIIKIMTFLAVGIFATYFLNDGIDELLEKLPSLTTANYHFMGDEGGTDTLTWLTYLLLSSSAILFLPRQFHIAVIENTSEEHIKTAKWLFPLYLFLINIFVLPIAISGKIAGLDPAKADYFVLLLSQLAQNKIFTLFIFLGGFSAAAGMIMLETITVSTIITNHLILPVSTRLKTLSWFAGHLLKLRWISAFFLIFASYGYMEVIGDTNALIGMGMISFVASLQFAPIVLGSLYWRGGSRVGAIVGLSFGALLWFYTLVIPSFIKSGYLHDGLLKDGLFGFSFLRPESLMGLSGFHSLTHSVFWTMLFNIGFFVVFSILYPPVETEAKIAEEFVSSAPLEIVEFVQLDESYDYVVLENKKVQFLSVLEKYFLTNVAETILKNSLSTLKIDQKKYISILNLAELYDDIEKNMAGYIGTSAAHNALKKANIIDQYEMEELNNVYAKLIASMKISPKDLTKQIVLFQEKEKLMKYETLKLEELIEQKNEELEEQKGALFQASKLTALGEMAGGIAHELNNPMAIISSTNQIMRRLIEKDDFDKESLVRYSENIEKTINRISKIINGLRTVSRDSSEEVSAPVTLCEVLDDVLSLCSEKIKNSGCELRVDLNSIAFKTSISCRRVQLSQVFLNLIGNAFDAVENLEEKWIQIDARIDNDKLIIRFIDSGKGIPESIQTKVIQPFFTTKEIGKGTGLGLSISHRIIKNHKGDFYIDNSCPNTCFTVELPLSESMEPGKPGSDTLAS